MSSPLLSEKKEHLVSLLQGYGSVAVAFSGGVDSAFLLKTAREALGENAAAVTIRAPFVPSMEQEEAVSFCAEYGIPQYFMDIEPDGVEGFSDNPVNRCYLCKKALFSGILSLADQLGFLCVAEGSNVDDEGDYRPGLQAIRELGVFSPLRESGLTKQDIRDLSREMGLPTWNKPSCACLASRFPYGEHIDRELLRRVDLAEQFLREQGFGQLRVRIHGAVTARIEVEPEAFSSLLSIREAVTTAFHEYGFQHISMDLEGYATGSMNRGIVL